MPRAPGANHVIRPEDRALIALRDVCKTYRSLRGQQVRAVEQLSLEIEAGEVLGVAGPNGAGKSTMLGMLLGFLQPTSGALRVEGLEPRTYVERHGASYVPELMTLPSHWTVQGTLRRLALLSGVPDERVNTEVDRVIETLQIGDHRLKRLKALSKGNLQRVGLAQALLTDARLMIFDEPTHGFDPIWTQRFRDLVAGLKRADRVIIIASHNLDELERLADRVAILAHGHLQRVVRMNGASVTSLMAYRLRAAAGARELAAQFPGATVAVNGDIDVPPVDLTRLNAGIAAGIAAGALLSTVVPRESVLEQAFHSAVGDGS